MIFEGTVFKYGRDVDTDAIIPARYLNTSDPKELAEHAMEDIDVTFAKRVKPGDIIVAEENFGCGSSREHAPVAIKAAGVSCVIAKSYARIFYRNAINVGLPIFECPSAVDGISDGDEVKADSDTGVITNLTTGESFQAEPFPAFIEEIINAGGLIERTRNKMLAKQRESFESDQAFANEEAVKFSEAQTTAQALPSDGFDEDGVTEQLL